MPIRKKKPSDEKIFYESRISSRFPSNYHSWFRRLGYPNLDLVEYSDGSWIIIQYLSSLATPTPLLKWQMVLGYMTNVIPTFGFVEKYVKRLDITKREFWARQEAKTKEVEDEHAALGKHREDFVNIAHKSFMKNPHMMERIAKNGLGEMDLDKLAKHVPKSEYIKPSFKGDKVVTATGKETHVSDCRQPIEQIVSSEISKAVPN